MNIEVLKQVVEVINHLGDNAKEGFITYLAVVYGVDVLEFLIGMGVLVLVISYAKGIITNLIRTGRCEAYFKTIRDANRLGASGFLSDGEFEMVKDFLNAAISEKKAKA